MSGISPDVRNALMDARDLMTEASRLLDGAVRQLLGNQAVQVETSPCDTCSTKAKCKSCEKFEKMLPGVEHGRGRRENLTGLFPGLPDRTSQREHPDKDYPSIVKELNVERLRSLFADFEGCKGIFTVKQWAAIELYYAQGRTQTEIGSLLQTTTSSVNELLDRAKRRLEGYHRKLARRNQGGSPE
jgi:predicted DNA-binding protein YlxM (UPF0122 family)